MKIKKFTENGELFLDAFLLDATKNENGWRVTPESIERNIQTFVGMPLVLTQDYSHPKWIDGGIVENTISQLRYAIGEITKVFAKDGKLYRAFIKITHPLGREVLDKIKEDEFELGTSPRIVHNPDNPDDKISDWMGLHLAVVNKPAFGFDKAAFRGACYGSSEQCHLALKEAKQEDCGFCVKTALTQLVTNLNDSSLTSLNSEGNNSILIMDGQAPMGIDTSKFISREEYDSKVKALESQVAGFKTVAEEAHKAADAKIAAIEEEKRVSKIEGHVKAKIADASKAQETIKKFVDAKVSPEIVADAMALIPDTKGKNNSELFTGKPADASSHVGSYEKASAYLNSIVRGAQI